MEEEVRFEVVYVVVVDVVVVNDFVFFYIFVNFFGFFLVDEIREILVFFVNEIIVCFVWVKGCCDFFESVVEGLVI